MMLIHRQHPQRGRKRLLWVQVSLRFWRLLLFCQHSQTGHAGKHVSASQRDRRLSSIPIRNSVFSPLHVFTAGHTCSRCFPRLSSNSVSTSSASLTARCSVQPKVTFWRECVSRALISLEPRLWSLSPGCVRPDRPLSSW